MPFSLRNILARFTALAILSVACLPSRSTAAEKSLLPAFGPEGNEFTTKAANNHVIHGWLPKSWDDNTEWAPITATYSKLEDSPDPASAALRIHLEKMDDGQLQFTSYAGERTYEHAKTYRISGWLRSSDQTALTVGVRQVNEPYEWYHEQDLPSVTSWKQFAFDFTPAKDIKALIMFAVKAVGTVDLAGVTITDNVPAATPTPAPVTAATASGKSLLPVFGPDGEEFTTPAKNNHVVHGWLPKDWIDNSEWAPITATYSKLTEGPDKTSGGLRIKLEKMDDGQLQLTSYTERIYEHGKIYRVAGWVRSPEKVGMSVLARQSEDPYQAYYEKEIPTAADWKQFEFEFAPKKDIKAIIMFTVKNVGTADLAGVTVTDEGSAE